MSGGGGGGKVSYIPSVIETSKRASNIHTTVEKP